MFLVHPQNGLNDLILNWLLVHSSHLKACDMDGFSSLFILIRVGVCEAKHLYNPNAKEFFFPKNI